MVISLSFLRLGGFGFAQPVCRKIESYMAYATLRA